MRDRLSDPRSSSPRLANVSRDLDPRYRARQLSKARQVLVDFTGPADKEKMRNTSLTSLLEEANKTLKDVAPESEGEIAHAIKLTHGGLLLEFSSQETLALLERDETKVAFLRGLGTSAFIRPRQYNVVVYYVPLTFKAGDPDGMREVENASGLSVGSIISTRWIKPPNRRSPRQVVAHAIFTFTDPGNANKALVNGLTVCQQSLNAIKSKREPVRCMKCQRWDHLASLCPALDDTCGSCGESHRTNLCSSPNKYCAPCRTDGHTSWDRECPTFTAKCREMDLRTPENLLTYFPTDEPWTHQTFQTPWTAANAPRQPQMSYQPTQSLPRPLIDRLAPVTLATNVRTDTLPRKRVRTRGRVNNSDPSLPSLNDPYPDPTPAYEDERIPQRSAFPPGRTGNHPDAWVAASGRGKRRGAAAGPSRLTQTRLDDYRSRPVNVNATLGPSRITAPALSITAPALASANGVPNPDVLLTQDFDDLIRSSNYFAPLTPEDDPSSPIEDETTRDPRPDPQPSLPSSDHPLSPAFDPRLPIPSHPRNFPSLSPISNWDDTAPPPAAANPTRNTDDSDDDISFSSHA
jgi:hypothetical protein